MNKSLLTLLPTLTLVALLGAGGVALAQSEGREPLVEAPKPNESLFLISSPIFPVVGIYDLSLIHI